jgi:aldehyde:ferredoxin oxidoreductase
MAGKVVDPEEFEQLLTLYYQKRGWDDNGVPPPEIEQSFT